MNLRALSMVVLSMMVAVPVLAQNEGPKPLALGAAAPMKTATMKNVDGRDLSIADIEGKNGTLVVFTCNHCPYAIAWEERIVKLGNGCAAKGIGMVAVNSNDPTIVPGDGMDDMKKRATERKMGFPYVVDQDSKLAKAFGATRTPEAFLFDAKGKLVYHGTIDDNHKEPEKVTKTFLADAVEAVAAGRPVELAETKALGCSIKFKK